MAQRIYYPITTFQQRRRLFELWQATGNVAEACRQARVSRSTFYLWKPRFETGGYAALAETHDHTPKRVYRKPVELVQQVIDLKRQHPAWGKHQIAQAINENDTSYSVSPNTVRRILQEAGLWSTR